ncbi:MAG: ATP-dependent metallopeptidase FtsH/Yme1/Tma family protein, partial [Candidatus Nanopelagicaceae bacterium]
MAQQKSEKKTQQQMNKKMSKKSERKKPQTRSQRILRGPLFWIIMAIVAVTIFGQVSAASNKYAKVTTSQIISAISNGQVDSALLIDKEQRIQV